MRLRPCDGGDALDEVEDALGQLTFFYQQGLDDPGALGAGEAALAQEPPPVVFALGNYLLERTATSPPTVAEG
jgi:hypothetical protein